LDTCFDSGVAARTELFHREYFFRKHWVLGYVAWKINQKVYKLAQNHCKHDIYLVHSGFIDKKKLFSLKNLSKPTLKSYVDPVVYFPEVEYGILVGVHILLYAASL
jgi:hypothetical protein